MERLCIRGEDNLAVLSGVSSNVKATVRQLEAVGLMVILIGLMPVPARAGGVPGSHLARAFTYLDKESLYRDLKHGRKRRRPCEPVGRPETRTYRSAMEPERSIAVVGIAHEANCYTKVVLVLAARGTAHRRALPRHTLHIRRRL